jgi:hypothetical protein
VPVKLTRVKLDVREYPVLAVTLLVTFNLNVVPIGGFTNPIVTNNVELKLKFDNENHETN